MMQKKNRRILSLLLVLALMLASLPSAFAAVTELDGDALDALSVGEHTYADGVSITSLPSSWSDASAVTKLTNGLLTMTVGGVETEVAVGTYEDEVVLTVTKYLLEDGVFMTAIEAREAFLPEAYRTGLYITSDGVVDEKSVFSAVTGYDATAVADGVIDSITIVSGSESEHGGSPQFSGLIFNGEDATNAAGNAVSYLLKNSSISLYSDADGNPYSSNDFAGLGAAIEVNNGAQLELDNVTIHVTGVARPAILSSGGSYLMKNSSFVVEGGEHYEGYRSTADFARMTAPPWVLGIAGNARGTNLIGQNPVNGFIDSTMTATGWGVLSSDSGSNGLITTVNSHLIMTGSTGYGIYAIGSVTENFYGTSFDVSTYAMILANGENQILFDSYTGGTAVDIGPFENVVSEKVANGETVDSSIKAQFGFMSHSGDSTLTLNSTTIETKSATFLHKSGSMTVNVDGSALTAENGVLIQMIDNDDSIVGVDTSGVSDQYGDYGMPVFNQSFVEAAGWQSATENDATDSFTASFENTALVGDMYNATGYSYNGGEASPIDLDITLGAGASLEGVVSTARAAHTWMQWVNDSSSTQGGYYSPMSVSDASKAAVEALGGSYAELTVNGTSYLQATQFSDSEYYNLGHVVNDAGAYSKAGASVTLTDDAVWTVTGESYLTALHIGANASVVAPSGYTLSMTVDGVSQSITAGTSYEGAIVLTLTAKSGVITTDTSSSSSSSSDVSITTTTNGTVSASKTNPSSGESVTITVTPNSGYVLDTLTVKTRAGATVEYVDNGDGTYTFTYPGAAVVVTATFREKTDADIELPFTDVAESDWYYEAVAYAYDNNLFNGLTATLFGPNDTMTRGMMTTVLYRMAGSPTVTGNNSFTDVAAGTYYENAIIWASTAGIVNGFGNGLFAPDDTITREQMAAMLYRYAGVRNIELTATRENVVAFIDADDISSWAVAEVNAMYRAEVINGTTTGAFDPQGGATRAQVAQMLMNFLENVAS